MWLFVRETSERNYEFEIYRGSICSLNLELKDIDNIIIVMHISMHQDIDDITKMLYGLLEKDARVEIIVYPIE